MFGGAPGLQNCRRGGRCLRRAGTYVEAAAPARVVQDWRFSSWADGITSRVRPVRLFVPAIRARILHCFT